MNKENTENRSQTRNHSIHKEWRTQTLAQKDCNDLTAEATTPWPLVSARVVSAGIALLLLARMGRSPIPRRDEARGAIVGAGILDMTANLAILVAVHHGMLSLVAVLGSLYPASTVLLARYVLQERMARTQVIGLIVALAAIGAIVGG